MHLTTVRAACDLRAVCVATASLKEADVPNEPLSWGAAEAFTETPAREPDAHVAPRTRTAECTGVLQPEFARETEAPLRAAAAPAVANAAGAQALTMVACISLSWDMCYTRVDAPATCVGDVNSRGLPGVG